MTSVDVESSGLDAPEHDELEALYEQSLKDIQEGQIVKGTIIEIGSNEILVDVGYKSEGLIPLHEFSDPSTLRVGDELDVLLEVKEDDDGMVVLSKRKADRVKGWERVVSEHGEGDSIQGYCVKKVKGGLILDIGVEAFLPASLVALKGYPDLNQYVGKTMDVRIIKVNRNRKNIVVSRKDFLYEERRALRDTLMEELEVGQRRVGTVKNITDFGAFVDLGGLDGLLHITDISWGRINHPAEVVQVGQELDVKVLDFNKEEQKVSLGLKQLSESPWDGVETRYPVGDRVQGKVVNIVPYGAFVELEKGIEGLVHISELSWTRRINNPGEVLQVGQDIEVVVLNVEAAQQKISLGVKQTEQNPWLEIEQRYPVGTVLKGSVRNLTDYGAFVEVEEGIDGLLHISDMSRTRKVAHPSEVVEKGDEIECVVLQVDGESRRISLGMKQLQPDPWQGVEERFPVGTEVEGSVVKVAHFGLFVELAQGLDGLLHVSELEEGADRSGLENIFQEGQRLRVSVIRVDEDERKIGLTIKDVEQPEGITIPAAPAADEADGEEPVADETATGEDVSSASTDTEGVEPHDESDGVDDTSQAAPEDDDSSDAPADADVASDEEDRPTTA